jgi:hypothetical protein
MLRTISSGAFIGSILALAVAYYLVITVIYFRKDLKNGVRPRKRKDGTSG